jgi:Zn-dependent protease with chaperone function
MTSYRYPSEQFTLFVTICLVLFFLLVSAGLTACLAPLLVGVFLLIAYQANQSRHKALDQQGVEVTPQRTPELSAIFEKCRRRIQPGNVEAIVVPSRQLNAYTFGFSDPKIVVLFDALFKVMDQDEIAFIMGHELGHVALGHTWLNTLLGSAEMFPGSFTAAVVLTLAFRWWNRSCEYSADRAGLLACGNINKAVSALVKLVAGDARTQQQIQESLNMIDKEDDSLVNILGESLSTHPMIIRRVEELKKFAASSEYQRLQHMVGN